jgi:tetratricopeptide (TPR) repeat protein
VEGEEFAALDALAKDTRQSALVWNLRATSLKNRGLYGEAKDVVDRAVGAARSSGDESLLAEALYTSAQVRIWSGDYAEAERAIGETETLAGENPRARLIATRLRSLLLLNRRQVEASRQLSLRVVELARELGDLEAEAEAECRISQALVEVGEFDAADRHFERSLALYPYARLSSGIAACGWRLAMINLALIRGRYAYAETELEDLLERCREIGAEQYVLAVTQGRALTAIYRGDAARALDIMQEVSEMKHDPLNVGLRGLVVGAACAELGLHRRAGEAFDDMVDVFGSLEPTQFFSMGLGLAILAALSADDLARATELGRKLEAFPDEAMAGDEFPHLAAWGLAALYGRLGEDEKRRESLALAARRYRTHQTKLAGEEGRRAYDAVPWNARFLAALSADGARTVAP